MNTGEHVGMVANGDGRRDHPEIAHLDLPPLGQPGRAMTLLTRSLLFVSEGDPIMVCTPPGAGPDAGKGFRAFDKETGDVVWETTFPAGNVGSPIAYNAQGEAVHRAADRLAGHPGEWIGAGAAVASARDGPVRSRSRDHGARSMAVMRGDVGQALRMSSRLVMTLRAPGPTLAPTAVSVNIAS